MAVVRDLFMKWLADEPKGPRPKITRNIPDTGDVVMAYLPSEGNPNRPGPHLRPALVLHVREQGKDAPLTLQVVPIRRKKGELQRAYQFALETKDGCAYAGVPHPAFIDLREKTIVSWSPKYISQKFGHPIIGRLRARDFKLFHSAYRAYLANQKMRQDAEKRLLAATSHAAPKPAPRDLSIAKAVRNRGREEVMWG